MYEQIDLISTIEIELTTERKDIYRISEAYLGDLIEIEIEVIAELTCKGFKGDYFDPPQPAEFEIIEINEIYKDKRIELNISEVLKNNDFDNEIWECLSDYL